MPRKPPKTPEEASRDNALKFNRQQVERHPLWVGAGLEPELREAGIILVRPENHGLRMQAQMATRMADLQQRHAREAELYRQALKREAPAAYREALLSLRRLRRLSPSMRGATKTCDHWHTRLRKALPQERWRAIECEICPAAAEEHRTWDWIQAQLQKQRERAGVQPLLPFGR